jgi:hypothetical protein
MILAGASRVLDRAADISDRAFGDCDRRAAAIAVSTLFAAACRRICYPCSENTFATLLALDRLMWGYVGILSLGHGAFTHSAVMPWECI